MNSQGEPVTMANTDQPKTYKIPSRSYGITAGEAADLLVTAQEISDHKELNAAALKVNRAKKKALAVIT